MAAPPTVPTSPDPSEPSSGRHASRPAPRGRSARIRRMRAARYARGNQQESARRREVEEERDQLRVERDRLVAELAAAKVEADNRYERLMDLVGGVDISLGVVDREGRVIAVNRAWEERMGISRNSAIGKRYEEFDAPGIDKEEVRAYQALIDGVLATGETLALHEMPVRKGATSDELYVDASIVPMRDAEGNVTGVLTVGLDVTADVRSRMQVEEQHALLDAIIQGSPIGLSLFDCEMRLVDANATWVAMMGMEGPPSTLKGQHLYDLLPSARSRETYHQRVLAGESIYLSDVEYWHLVSGRALYCDVYYTPLREAGGAVKGVLVALVDMTGRREVDMQKDDFLALAAHELKSPITSIKGLSQMLMRRAQRAEAEQQLDDRTIRSLNVIDEQTGRLTALIDEMLDVSRIGGDRLELHIAPTNLADLVKGAVSTSELAAPDFLFTLDMPTTAARVVVNADMQRIEQVLSNLLQNAVKYSGNVKRVDVSLTLQEGDTDAGEAVVAVRDYGIGIPANELQRVFERYFRASNTRYKAGLGLGLFISHGIIEAHGGKMWCESSEGKGSTFCLSLPLA